MPLLTETIVVGWVSFLNLTYQLGRTRAAAPLNEQGPQQNAEVDQLEGEQRVADANHP